MLKYFFAFIMLIHGLIHFMGFAKAYNYGNITQLTKYISKPVGLLWLITAILFIVAVLLFLLKKESWPYIAIIAAVVSQILIITVWKDAKFGTIVNIIIMAFSIIGYVQTSFKNVYKTKVRSGLQESNTVPTRILTEKDIEPLPDAVKRYIRYTGCIDKPLVNNFRIDFVGKIRSHEKKVWMQLTSEQFNFIKTPTRLFYMDATMKGLPLAGFHCFKNGVAYMDIRLLSMFKVEFQSGPVMDTSETVTYFNDICVMAPAALIDKRITWLQEDGNKIKASFTYNGISISAWLYFNEKAELINFVSEDRSALLENGKTVKLPWSTPLSDYKNINGYRLAGYAEAIYTYPDGDFAYATFTLKNIIYNVKNL